MNFSLEFWFQISVYVVSIGVVLGSAKTHLKYISQKIDKLEEKQDKHNRVIERMYVVEESAKSAHHRIDELREKKE